MRIVTPDEKNGIYLGRQGENLVTEVQFDVSVAVWEETYGVGTWRLLNRRPSDPAGYPVEIAVENDVIKWIPTATDLKYAGCGTCELIYTVEDAIAKSIIYGTQILPAIDGTGEIPEPWESWIDEVVQARDDAQAAAVSAAGSAVDAAESAVGAAGSAVDAAAAAVEAAELADQIEHSIDDIEAIIPPQASPENQLADKNFVNSSVATNTANYISNNGEPFTSVAQLEAYSGTVTNNDYAFVTGTDSEGNTYYDRYKATVSGGVVTWAKEYRLNNSSFTAVQWAAIESGITASLVASYSAHVADKNNPHEVTAAQVGLGNVDNTSDALKPVSTPQRTALAKKADKVSEAVEGNLAGLDASGNLTDSGAAPGIFQLKYVARTLTLAAASWSGGSQTVAARGVTATNLVEVAPASKADADLYLDGEVWCSAQSADALTFSCGSTAPAADITVNVVVWDDRSAPILPEVIKDRLEFTSESPFTLASSSNAAFWNGTLEYSSDGSTWATWGGTSAISSGLVDGKSYLALRGTGNTKIGGANLRLAFSGTDMIDANGDLDALLDYATYSAGNEPSRANETFRYLFSFNSLLRTAPTCNASRVTQGGLEGTFYGCSGLLVAPPRLPAASVGHGAYSNMFRNCTSLVNPPKSIDAPALADSACFYMFYGDTSLKRPPKILATTLGSGSLNQMFLGCTSLEALPELKALNLPSQSLYWTFYGCSKIKLSQTMIGEYINAYRLPSEGTGTASTTTFGNTFTGTGGTFTGNPEINTTYYTSNDIVAAD